MCESEFVIPKVLWFILHPDSPMVYRHKCQFIGYSLGTLFHFFLLWQVASCLDPQSFGKQKSEFSRQSSQGKAGGGNQVDQQFSFLKLRKAKLSGVARTNSFCRLNLVFLRYLLIPLTQSSQIFLDYQKGSHGAFEGRRW